MLTEFFEKQIMSFQYIWRNHENFGLKFSREELIQYFDSLDFTKHKFSWRHFYWIDYCKIDLTNDLWNLLSYEEKLCIFYYGQLLADEAESKAEQAAGEDW